jgi:hypothetical protein
MTSLHVKSTFKTALLWFAHFPYAYNGGIWTRSDLLKVVTRTLALEQELRVPAEGVDGGAADGVGHPAGRVVDGADADLQRVWVDRGGLCKRSYLKVVGSNPRQGVRLKKHFFIA